MQRLLPTAALTLCLVPALGHASEQNPAVEACKTRGEGDACTLKEPKKGPEGLTFEEVAGACVSDECCEQDYSKGSPPEVTCGPCLSCKPGATPTPSPSPAEPGGEPPKAGDEPPAAAGSKRGCTTGGAASWWSLLWLLPLARVRRRRA